MTTQTIDILNAREKLVFTYIISGLTIKEIAVEICKSASTVSKYIISAKRKMQAKNIPHAVALFLKLQRESETNS